MDMREIYQEKADAQLRVWQEWIENFKTDPPVSGEKKAVNYEQITERLEDSHRAARFRLEELRAAQDETWELSKQAVERAMIDLKKLLDESGAVQAGRFLRLQTSRMHIYEPFSKRG
jgi:hypothetical protein